MNPGRCIAVIHLQVVSRVTAWHLALKTQSHERAAISSVYHTTSFVTSAFFTSSLLRETALLLVLDGNILSGSLHISFVGSNPGQLTFLNADLIPSEIFSVVPAFCLWPALPRIASTPLSTSQYTFLVISKRRG